LNFFSLEHPFYETSINGAWHKAQGVRERRKDQEVRPAVGLYKIHTSHSMLDVRCWMFNVHFFTFIVIQVSCSIKLAAFSGQRCRSYETSFK